MREGPLDGEAVQRGVGERVELQREEQEVRRHRRDAVTRVGHELGPRGIGRVLRVEELRVGGGAPEHLVEPLVARHRLGEAGAGLRFLGDGGEAAPVVGGEAFRVVGGLGEVLREAGRVHGGV